MIKCAYCNKETDRVYPLKGPDRVWDFCFFCYKKITDLIGVIIQFRINDLTP